MKKIIFSLFFVFIIQSAFSQIIKLDLSAPDYSQTVDPMVFNKIELDNCIISSDTVYYIEIKKTETPVPELELVKSGSENVLLTDKEDSICNVLQKEYDNLTVQFLNAKNEKVVRDLRVELDKIKTVASSEGCPIVLYEIKILESRIKREVKLVQSVSLKNGDKVEIRIRKNGRLFKVYTLETEYKNPWSVMIGFTYKANFFSSANCYSKDTLDSFVIRPLNQPKYSYLIFENITPTVFFTYMKARNDTLPERWLRVGVSGGISLDLTNPTAMIGPSFVIGENLSFNLGLVFGQKHVLKGIYSIGDIIDENKTFDDLHEKVYMPDVFFSIAYRFKNDIFNGIKVAN